MSPEQARIKADEFIMIALHHQPNLFPNQALAPLSNQQQANQAAEALAAFRATLIAQLTEQDQ